MLCILVIVLIVSFVMFVLLVMSVVVFLCGDVVYVECFDFVE